MADKNPINSAFNIGKQVVNATDSTSESLTDLNKILKGMIPGAGATALASGFEKSLDFVIKSLKMRLLFLIKYL